MEDITSIINETSKKKSKPKISKATKASKTSSVNMKVDEDDKETSKSGKTVQRSPLTKIFAENAVHLDKMKHLEDISHRKISADESSVVLQFKPPYPSITLQVIHADFQNGKKSLTNADEIIKKVTDRVRELYKRATSNDLSSDGTVDDSAIEQQ